jgi:SAM-dependent methyltransferase
VEVTRDGSLVEVYRRLPAIGEAELIQRAIPAGATVLDLGCGTGRITRGLVAVGHPVTGVDDSPAMIAELPPNVTGVVAEGLLVGEAYAPEFDWAAAVGRSTRLAEVELTLERAAIDDTRVDAVVVYAVGDRSWRRSWPGCSTRWPCRDRSTRPASGSIGGSIDQDGSWPETRQRARRERPEVGDPETSPATGAQHDAERIRAPSRPD